MKFWKSADKAPRIMPAVPHASRERIQITFDMMLKGSVAERRGRRIRQFGVSLHGATRVITSGDFVSREVYDALVAAGAVMPQAGTEEPA